MKPKQFPLFQVRPFDPLSLDKTAPTNPQFFADLFDARIIIRDALGRSELPNNIRRRGPALAYPRFSWLNEAGNPVAYLPALIWLYVADPTNANSGGQILIAYQPEKTLNAVPAGAPADPAPYRLNCAMVKLLREAFGYSQAQAATMAGFSPQFPAQAWYALENGIGERTVTEPTIERIALLFDVHPRALLMPPHNAPPVPPAGVPSSAASMYVPFTPEQLATPEALRAALHLDAARVVKNA